MRLQFENFMCKVCNNVFKFPTADSCGHTFCRKCLHKLLESQSKCPISDQSLYPEYKSKNLTVSQMLDGAVKYCENETSGCSWKGKPRRFYKLHRNQCVFGDYKYALSEALKNDQLKIGLNYKRIELSAESVFEGLVDEKGEPEFGIEYLNGKMVYEGGFLDRLRHGVGKCYIDDSTVIEGQFYKGQAGGQRDQNTDVISSGFAVKYVNGKSTVEGFWADGKLNGKALVFSEDGLEIESEFRDDQHVGDRRVKYPNGRVFAGTFEDGQMKEGLLIYQDRNTRFKGTFLNNQPHGHGVLTKNGALTYTGEFKNGAFDGFGILETISNKSRYEGEFKNGVKEGTGIMYSYWQREEYHGPFVNDKYNGQGLLIHQDSCARITGKFVNGFIVGSCTINYDDGRVYTGPIHNRLPNDIGKMRFPNGDVYTGPWRAGQMEGPSGKMTYANGDLFEGTYHSNQRKGNGTFTFANGDKFVGNYIKDNAEGPGKLIFTDESYLEGKWNKNLLHGVSQFYEKGRSVSEIVWNNGVKVEERSVKKNASIREVKKGDKNKSEKELARKPQAKPKN